MKQRETFPAEYGQLRPMCAFVLRGAAEAGFDEQAITHIELACDEAITNIIEHAYAGETTGEIKITWEVTWEDNVGSFRVMFADQGKPFNPDGVALPTSVGATADTPPDAIHIGGLGIHLIRQLVDEVTYQFDEDENRVIFVKKVLRRKREPVQPRSVWHKGVENHPDIDVVGVRGRLDHTIIPDLERILLGLYEDGRHHLIIDLSQTTYTNSGGLRVIVSAWRKARANDGDVVLFGLSPSLQEIFEMVGFDKILTIEPDLEHAIVALSNQNQN